MIVLQCEDNVDNLRANHEANKNRAKSIQAYLRSHKNVAKGKTAIICAAGPSLKDNIAAIAQHSKNKNIAVFSVKTGNYLHENGVHVDFNVHLDTKPTELKYIHDTPNTVHFISTQCLPEMFDKYPKNKVYRFLSRTSATYVPSSKHIAQGSNTTLQTVCIAAYMGFKNIVIYGFDLSWIPEETTHINGDRDAMRKVQNVPILLNNGKEVMTNLVMMGAAQEAVQALRMMGGDVTVQVIGEYYLQDYMKDILAGRYVETDEQVHNIITNKTNKEVWEDMQKKAPNIFRLFPSELLDAGLHLTPSYMPQREAA